MVPFKVCAVESTSCLCPECPSQSVPMSHQHIPDPPILSRVAHPPPLRMPFRDSDDVDRDADADVTIDIPVGHASMSSGAPSLSPSTHSLPPTDPFGTPRAESDTNPFSPPGSSNGSSSNVAGVSATVQHASQTVSLAGNHSSQSAANTHMRSYSSVLRDRELNASGRLTTASSAVDLSRDSSVIAFDAAPHLPPNISVMQRQRLSVIQSAAGSVYSRDREAMPNNHVSFNLIPSPGPGYASGMTSVVGSTTALPHGMRESFAAPPLMPLSRSSTYYGSKLSPPSSAGSGLGPASGSGSTTTSGSTGVGVRQLTVGGPISRRHKKRVSTLRAAVTKSTALIDASKLSKPWMHSKDTYQRLSWWLTFMFMLVGVGASVVRIWFGMKSVPLLKGNLCLVMEDEFEGDTIDTTIWRHEVDLGGYGNGEFEMTTSSTNNSYVRDGFLHIVPTLTSDVIGTSAIFDSYTFNLTGCTNTNLSACGAISNKTTKTVINPVQSARLTTLNSASIQYGKVEIRAKLPQGDWIWPALWMLPLNNTYGPWPISGEIDIMEARGNAISYPKQGRNYVRASLNWGPLTWLNEVSKTFGWVTNRRKGYDQDFHTYTLEWSKDFMRVSVDTRLQPMLDIRFDESFFQRGDFPKTVFNGSQEITLTNPWVGYDNSAPFNQPFFLILNVAVGGTNGWFPDNFGSKPWLDGSNTAMYDFAAAQDTWFATWPSDEQIEDRGMTVDYVRMWQQC